jgi:hypothetical protein
MARAASARAKAARFAGRRPIHSNLPGRGKVCINDAKGLSSENAITSSSPRLLIRSRTPLAPSSEPVMT